MTANDVKSTQSKALESQFCAPGRVRDDSYGPERCPKQAQETTKFSDSANFYPFSVLWKSLRVHQVDFCNIFSGFCMHPSSFCNSFYKNILTFHRNSVFTTPAVLEFTVDIQIIPCTSSTSLQRTKLPNLKFPSLRSQVGLGGARRRKQFHPII